MHDDGGGKKQNDAEHHEEERSIGHLSAPTLQVFPARPAYRDGVEPFLNAAFSWHSGSFAL
jgi:hypothetical protein